MIKFTSRHIIFTCIFIVVCAVFVAAQEETQPNLETILKNADEKTQNYREEFKNLLATETKTFEIYNKDGDLKKSSTVESNFIIFQSIKDQNVTSEYRDVYKVDDKTIGDNQTRANDLLNQLAKSSSVEQELKKIQKESLRYDKNLEINGLTLLQSPILEDYARPFFDFKLAGRDVINGSEVYVVEYQQTKPSPYVLINKKGSEDEKTEHSLVLNYNLGLPKSLNNSNVFLRGKLWIDTKTFQLWREERELTAQTANPVVILKSDFEYQPSEFGILVPKKISLVQYDIKKKGKDSQISAVKDTQVDFAYSKFRKANSDVQIIEDN
ncbi:MAG: hypothetical protein ABI891_15485 [Acidobacteriota bacterium]